MSGLAVRVIAIACDSQAPDFASQNVQSLDVTACDTVPDGNCGALTCAAGYEGTPPTLSCTAADTWTFAGSACTLLTFANSQVLTTTGGEHLLEYTVNSADVSFRVTMPGDAWVSFGTYAFGCDCVWVCVLLFG